MPRRASGGSFGRADVHAAIELHRVGVDDLGRAAAGRELVGEVEGEFGLAGSRCADEGDEHRSARPEGRQADVDSARFRTPTGPVAGTAHDSASARSQASPARVRRIGSSAPAGPAMRKCGVARVTTHAHDVAGTRDGAALGHIEVNEPAVFGATRESVVLLVATTFAGGDEHLDGAADERLVLLARDALLQFDEALEALLHDLLRHLIGQRRRRSAGTDRVLEGERRGESRLLDDAQGVLEVLLGLARGTRR